jgi:hypothetical protein
MEQLVVDLVSGSWKALLAALLIFGFAPGLCTRLISLVYPKHDARRQEMVAEVYVVPRWERPFWVFQQLETAILSGLPARWRDHREYRAFCKAASWKLMNAERLRKRSPRTFWIPEASIRSDLPLGAAAQLVFRTKDGWGERMWVEVVDDHGDHYVGMLLNTPVGIPMLEPGAVLEFSPRHVINVDPPDDRRHERKPDDDVCSVVPMCDGCHPVAGEVPPPESTSRGLRR